ncbi:MAG: inositol-3-phosphate synthase, partial [Sphingomonas sp.]
MKTINVAVIGIGNCASSLVQGLAFYHKGSNDHVGLMHWDLGGYKPSDIKVVAAWDVDTRKVGVDVSDAIFAKPNCTAVFCADVPPSGVKVKMGNVLDGVADHMADYADDRTFIVADLPQPTKAEVVAALRESKADVLMNYLPVGSQKATEFY